jgi:hypothetical protein
MHRPEGARFYLMVLSLSGCLAFAIGDNATATATASPAEIEAVFSPEDPPYTGHEIGLIVGMVMGAIVPALFVLRVICCSIEGYEYEKGAFTDLFKCIMVFAPLGVPCAVFFQASRDMTDPNSASGLLGNHTQALESYLADGYLAAAAGWASAANVTGTPPPNLFHALNIRCDKHFPDTFASAYFDLFSVLTLSYGLCILTPVWTVVLDTAKSCMAHTEKMTTSLNKLELLDQETLAAAEQLVTTLFMLLQNGVLLAAVGLYLDNISKVSGSRACKFDYLIALPLFKPVFSPFWKNMLECYKIFTDPIGYKKRLFAAGGNVAGCFEGFVAISTVVSCMVFFIFIILVFICAWGFAVPLMLIFIPVTVCTIIPLCIFTVPVGLFITCCEESQEEEERKRERKKTAQEELERKESEHTESEHKESEHKESELKESECTEPESKESRTGANSQEEQEGPQGGKENQENGKKKKRKTLAAAAAAARLVAYSQKHVARIAPVLRGQSEFLC